MRKLIPLLLIFSSLSFGTEWKWHGFEVIGNRSVSREEIIKALPISVGSPYKEDPQLWNSWCNDIKKKFNFPYVKCSAVRFIDFKAYLTVDVVEKGEEYRFQFRPAPQQEVPIASPEVFLEHDLLMKRLWELFDKGINAGEFTNGDYVDFKDEEMHQRVLKLLSLAPKHRANLIEILKNHKDPIKRATSAWILCWALTPTDTIEKVFSLIDDPDMNVRNDISRFMHHWIGKLPAATNKKLLDALALQMKRPSHADRNKSLLSLQAYLSTHPQAIEYFKKIGKAEVDYIASTSVLENVNGPAKDIQKLLANH